MKLAKYAVNCSIMWTDRALPERLEAVRAAGFEAVESWWPFRSAAPGDREVDRFIADIRTSGLRLVALNLYGGDLLAGDRGLMSWPGHSDEMRTSAQIAAYIGGALGCRGFNGLYGRRRPDMPAAEQDHVATENLAAVAAELADIGGTVLVEPLSGVSRYPLRTADHVVQVVDRVYGDTGQANLGLLLDVYHLATNGDDVASAIDRHRSRIAHVQVADAPGRGAPGTGRLPLESWIGDVLEGGYTGWVALEYVTDDDEPFAWCAHN